MPVVVTPEFSAATGLPLSEKQLERVVNALFDTLSNGGDFMRCHLASVLVHYTGESQLLGDRKLKPADPAEPIVLNIALIGKKDREKVTVNLFHKQLIDPKDIFSHYGHYPDAHHGQSLNLERIMHSDITKEMSVSELCLENKSGIGLVSVGEYIAKIKTTSSVDINSYSGYHVLMSDTIHFLTATAAFGLIVHCDAREIPSVRVLGEKDDDGKVVDKIKDLTIRSKSRIADGAELHIFEPVSLQPLTENAVQEIKERLESHRGSFKPL